MQLRHGLALLLLIGSTAALAQVQVREAGTSRNTVAQAPVQPQQNPNTEFVATLYTQLEALQQEVQTLRGVVEEQSYQLKRMQTEQKDRYLDIDRRLSSITNPSASNNNSAKNPAPVIPPPSLDTSSAAPNSATTVSTQPAPPPVSNVTPAGKKIADNGMDEQELYRTALNLLLQENKAEASVPMFQSYIDSFPKGRLFTNALYWQGEAFLVIAANDKARDVFLRLLADYPADAKAAGAMLKLGVAYKKLGDKAKAVETWKQIRTKFPENANEIRLAEENLKAP